MSLRMKSSAWLFFDKTSDPSISKCSLCSSSIKSHNNSTTNLLKHLRSRHSEETSSEINWESSGAENFNGTDIPSATDMSEDKVDESNEISMPFEMIDTLLSTSTPSITRSRSPVWYCFTKMKDENQAKCKFCSSLLSYNESNGTTNLLNHFMHNHEQIYQQVVTEISTNDTEAEDFSALEYTDFQEAHDPADSGTEVSSDAPAVLIDGLATVANAVVLNQLSSQTDRRKTTRSLAWACFSRIANSEVAICKYCRVVVKTESGSTSNMLNHFSRRHAKEFDEAKAKRVLNHDDSTEHTLGDIPGDVTGEPDDTLQDDSLCTFTSELTASELTERTNRSIVWSCFNRNSFSCENGVHECIHCGAHLRSDQGSTSSMLAHFMKKHPAEYRAAITDRSVKSGSKSSMIRKHFSQLTSDDWCCCFCQRLLRQTGGSSSNLVKHLMKKHREEYNIIFADLNSSPRSVVVKTERVEDDIEEDDDSYTNGTYKDLNELPNQLLKRRKILSATIPSFGESPLSKMTTLWGRHCLERQKEHDRQLSGMKEKLSALQESMKKIRGEIVSVQGEISRTEDAWRKETTRQKEVNRQFQIALKQAETEPKTVSSTRTSSAGALAMDVDDSEVDKSF